MSRKPIESLKTITVIETVSVIGKGDKDDSARYLYQYWAPDGKLLAEHDTINDVKADGR